MAKDPFIELAKQYEPKIRRALLKAWVSMRKDITLKQAKEWLETGGPELLLNEFDKVAIQYGGQAADEVASAWKAGGDLSMSLLPAGAVLNPNATFDMFNQHNIDFLQKYRFELINTISSNTRDALRQGLSEDIIAGKNPLETARNFKNNIGLTPNQEKAVRNYRSNLEALDKDVLRRKLRDGRFDRTIKNAIDSDTPLTKAQIDKFTNRYRERYIKYRSEVIARTESLRAISIGNENSMRQLIMNGDIDPNRVRRFWRFTKDSKTRDPHRKIPGMNPEGVGMDEPFKTPLGNLMYPRDPSGTAENTVQCRCSVYYKIVEDPIIRDEDIT